MKRNLRVSFSGSQVIDHGKNIFAFYFIPATLIVYYSIHINIHSFVKLSEEVAIYAFQCSYSCGRYSNVLRSEIKSSEELESLVQGVDEIR